jgi:hypothetical protein
LLLSTSSITSGTIFGISQKTRRGGGVTDKEEKDLDKSLLTRGSLLNVPPGSVYTPNLECQEHIYITGHTRDGRYGKYNFLNRLVSVYVKKDGCRDDEVANELSQLGNIFNPKTLPQSEAKEYDIIDEGIRAVQNKWVVRDVTSIMERIKLQCEAVGIRKVRRSYLATVIYNDTGNGQILPMTQEKAAIWKDNSKYKDIPGKIRYIVKSYDMVSKGCVDAAHLAKKYPNEEIRVIVHCGIITGGLEQYTSRVIKFWTDWYNIYNAFQQVVFGGKTQNIQNLTLYGIIPQIGEDMDTEQLCLYVQSGDGEFTQKLNDEKMIWGV